MAFFCAHTSRAKGRAWEYSNEPIGVGCSAATHSFPLPPERVNLSLITKKCRKFATAQQKIHGLCYIKAYFYVTLSFGRLTFIGGKAAS